MTTSGNPEMWADTFPLGLIPDIIGLIVNTWKSNTKPAVGDLEVGITRALVVGMRRSKIAQKLPFLVYSESEELHEVTNQLSGRIDIRFSAGFREDVYFAVECKRLRFPSNKGIRANTSEYIGANGMMCFVRGQYGLTSQTGGMLAYVMDGDINRAIAAIASSMKRSMRMLCITGTTIWKDYKSAPNCTFIKESKHKFSNRKFIVYHTFLGV